MLFAAYDITTIDPEVLLLLVGIAIILHKSYYYFSTYFSTTVCTYLSIYISTCWLCSYRTLVVVASYV